MKERKSKLLSILLCLTLAVGSVFGLCFQSGIGYADGADNVGSLRFQQLAAGDGFVIGLTYDNQLYGWSLTGSGDGLAGSYNTTPTKIAVNLVRGPSTAGASYTDADGTGYWTPDPEDKIAYIAATATAAAFVTQKGFIYTWGQEKNWDLGVNNNSEASSLLLRTAGSGNKSADVPCMINYGYGTNALFGDNRPTGARSLYAGEDTFYYNYTLTNGGSGSMAWGAYNFAQRPSDGQEISDNIYGGISGVDVIGGGDTAAFISGGFVYVKGKNYYLPSSTLNVGMGKDVQLANYEGNIFNTTANSRIPYMKSATKEIQLPRMFDISGANYLQIDSNTILYNNFSDEVTSDKFAGDFTLNASSEGVAWITIGENTYYINEGAVYYRALTESEKAAIGESGDKTEGAHIGNFGQAVGLTVSSTQAGGTAQYKPVNLYDAAATQSDDTVRAQARRQQLSLGNGYGYLINGTSVYAFGNNAAGQYGNSTSKTVGGYTAKPVSVSGTPLAVAAGLTRRKQQSFVSSLRGTLDGSTLTITSDSVDGDGAEYISGALTSAGLFVWNKDISVTDKKNGNIIDKFKPYGVTATGKHTLATIVSGYGNNLFAISNLGKIFRIQATSSTVDEDTTYDFSVTMYDSFNNYGNGGQGVSPIKNYDPVKTAKINFDTSNAPTLSDPNARKTADGTALSDRQGAVLTLGSLTNALSTDVEKSYSAASIETYQPVISANRSGDAFRILLNEDDLTLSYNTSGDKIYHDRDAEGTDKRLIRFYLNSVDAANELKPTLSNGAQREPGRLDWYLEYKVSVVDDDVQIALYPLRATGADKIIMTYYVGRYDTAAKFVAGDGGDMSSKTDPTFYDEFQVQVEITVANTKAVGNMITSYLGGDDDNNNPADFDYNATVPLLDPNYELNRYYSIAVNDVSADFEVLKNVLGSGKNQNGAPAGSVYDDAYDTLFYGKILKEDSGFPSVAKQDDPGMQYLYRTSYLQKRYDGKYKYFVYDRDGDIINPTLNGTVQNNKQTYFTLAQKTVKLSFENQSSGSVDANHLIAFTRDAVARDYLRTFGIVVSEETKTVEIEQDGVTTSESVTTLVVRRNGVTVTYVDSHTDPVSGENVPGVMTVAYDVVQIRADRSTGSARYGEGDYDGGVEPDADKGVDVARFNITDRIIPVDEKAAYTYVAGFTFTENVNGTQTGVLDLNRVRNRVQLPLHAQASLQTTGGYNAYTEEKNRISVTMSSVQVGTSASHIMRTLSQLVSDGNAGVLTDSTNLYFTNYVESTKSYQGYDEFAAQFDSEVCEVKLARTSIEFTPKVADTYQFTVIVRRSSRRSSSDVIVPFADGKETLYIDFTITATRSAFETNSDVLTTAFASRGDKATNPTSVAATETITVNDMVGTSKLDVNIVSVKSSDESKLLATVAADRKSFTMVPRASGPVSVAYTIEQYGIGYSGVMHVQVEGRSTLTDTLSIIERESVMLSELRSEIEQDNKASTGIDFSALELDTFEAADRPDADPNRTRGYYFINTADNTVITTNNGWPSFVSNVELINDTTTHLPSAFRITVGNYNTGDNQTPSALFVVCFRVGNRKFEGAVVVEPRTRYLKAVEGGDLVMNIDMKSSGDEDGAWTKDSTGKVTINFSYIKGLPCMRDITEIDSYSIRMVTASEDANRYFTYDNTPDAIILNPEMPMATQEALNISIADASTGRAYVLTMYVTITGIRVTLEKTQYLTILLASAGGVAVLILIIYVIRLGVYWKKRAAQRRIIKKNQMLIRMRDKVHNSTSAATREQIVKTKLKLEDPKYAKMFNEMRKDKEPGITLDGSPVTQAIGKLPEEKGKKKKKKGKKSINDLKAELEAKKAAFASMQAGDMPMDTPPMQFDQGGFEQPPFEQPAFDQNGFEQPAFDQNGFDGAAQDIVMDATAMNTDAGEIVFDAEPVDNNQ